MTLPFRRTPIYYGWVVVVAGVFGNATSAGFIFWATAVYIPAVSDDLGVGRFPVVTGFVVGQAVSAAVGLFAGAYMDRYGARRAIGIGTLIAPIGLVLTSILDGAVAPLRGLGGWGVIRRCRGHDGRDGRRATCSLLRRQALSRPGAREEGDPEGVGSGARGAGAQTPFSPIEKRARGRGLSLHTRANLVGFQRRLAAERANRGAGRRTRRVGELPPDSHPTGWEHT